MKAKLMGLKNVSQIALDAELAKLSALSEQLSQKADELSKLRQSSRDRAAALNDLGGDDLAFLNGQDELFRKWQERQVRSINTEIANLAAAREHQLSVTRRAFGKTNALDQLIKKTTKP